MPGAIHGVSVRQTGRAAVPQSFLSPDGEPPTSFLRHFWPSVSSLDRFYWTPSLLDPLRESANPQVIALLQLLRDDQLVPPQTVFPEFSWAVGGGWLDFYGFTKRPSWPVDQWLPRCRGEGLDASVRVAFRCYEGDLWTLHSREEGLLAEMKQATRRVGYLSVEDAESLPVMPDRLTLFPRPREA